MLEYSQGTSYLLLIVFGVRNIGWSDFCEFDAKFLDYDYEL